MPWSFGSSSKPAKAAHRPPAVPAPAKPKRVRRCPLNFMVARPGRPESIVYHSQYFSETDKQVPPSPPQSSSKVPSSMASVVRTSTATTVSTVTSEAVSTTSTSPPLPTTTRGTRAEGGRTSSTTVRTASSGEKGASTTSSVSSFVDSTGSSRASFTFSTSSRSSVAPPQTPSTPVSQSGCPFALMLSSSGKPSQLMHSNRVCPITGRTAKSENQFEPSIAELPAEFEPLATETPTGVAVNRAEEHITEIDFAPSPVVPLRHPLRPSSPPALPLIAHIMHETFTSEPPTSSHPASKHRPASSLPNNLGVADHDASKQISTGDGITGRMPTQPGHTKSSSVPVVPRRSPSRCPGSQQASPHHRSLSEEAFRRLPSHDRAVFQVVEMGFTADEAKNALLATSAAGHGLDVGKATAWLVARS